MQGKLTIQDIVQEHSFVPNVVATMLARGRTRLIGVIAPPLNRPAIPEIMRGVAKYIDLILSAHMRPPLTTIRQPFADMGRTAIETLLTMIEPDHRTHITPPSLVEEMTQMGSLLYIFAYCCYAVPSS